MDYTLESSASPSSLPPGLTLGGDDAPYHFQFQQHYELIDKIGKGSFGMVFLSKHIASGEEFAVKRIDRKRLSDREHSNVIREVNILSECRDIENIVRLIDFYCSPEHFYVVQVFAAGGDLFNRLGQHESYNEKNAQDLAFNLMSTIHALHQRKIVHRDLKPENLLLADIIDDTRILLADFGFATHVPPEGLRTRCGTPAFVAPEIIVQNCRYDERIDMWSVGCLLYMLLGGYPPFQDKNHKGLFRKIRGCDFCFHDVTWRNVSKEAKGLIANLLIAEPAYRFTAAEALGSMWFRLSANDLKNRNLSASIGEIKAFNARRQFKSAIYTTMVASRGWFLPRGGANKPPADDDDTNNNGGFRLSFAHRQSSLIETVSENRNFKKRFELGGKIQSDQTCEWWECTNRATKEVYAVKIVDRRQSIETTANGRSVAEAVMHEAAILDSLEHESVVQFVDFFEEEEAFYLVSERMYGGDLYDRIAWKQKYTEIDAREIVWPLLQAVSYLHEERVAHRDLKPQNLLFKTSQDGNDIKISDFSFACRVIEPQSLTTRCGTPTYVAPEILKNVPYDQAVDMWSLGVILYVLLCGYPPFADDNQKELFRKIRMGDWSFKAADWKRISKPARELIKSMLVVNPAQRCTAREALASDWFTADLSDGADLSRAVKRSVRADGGAPAHNAAATTMNQQPAPPSDAVGMDTSSSNEDAMRAYESERSVARFVL